MDRSGSCEDFALHCKRGRICIGGHSMDGIAFKTIMSLRRDRSGLIDDDGLLLHF